MALYLTQESVENMLNSSMTPLLSIGSSNITGNNGLIQQLQRRENEMLGKLIGPGATRESLRIGLEAIKANNPQLEKLGGEALQWSVRIYSSKVDKEHKDDQARFQAYLDNHWEEWFRNYDFSKDPKGDQIIERFLLSIVDQTIEKQITIGESTHGGRVRSLRSFRGGDFKEKKDLQKIILTDLAEVTQARIRLFLSEYYAKNPQEDPLNGGKMGTKNRGRRKKANVKNAIKIDENKSELEVLNWYEITGGDKGSDINISKKEARQKLDMFKDMFKLYLNKIPDADAVVDQAFSKFEKDPVEAVKHFFIGGNEQNITGLCGEIRALIYLRLLVGEGGFKNVRLSAKALEAGKQFHSDITLLKEYGFQVKNTLDETFKQSINFRNVKIRTFFEKANITSAQQEAVENVINAYVFNVPYVTYSFHVKRKTDTIFGEGKNEDFAPTRKRIEDRYNFLQVILTYLISRLLYIGIGNASKNQDANIVYFIGQEVLFASEIVKQIFDEIHETERSFDITIVPNSSYNIVNYMLALGGYGKFSDKRRASFMVNDDQIINSTWLRSSYNFANLINSFK